MLISLSFTQPHRVHDERMAAKDLKQRLKNRPLTEEIAKRPDFTMLQEDASLLDELVDRYNERGARTNKAEVVRLGLRALVKIGDEKALQLLCNLLKLKTGRRSKD